MDFEPEIGKLYKFRDPPPCNCVACTKYKGTLVEVLSIGGEYKLWFTFYQMESWYPKSFFEELASGTPTVI